MIYRQSSDVAAASEEAPSPSDTSPSSSPTKEKKAAPQGGAADSGKKLDQKKFNDAIKMLLKGDDMDIWCVVYSNYI